MGTIKGVQVHLKKRQIYVVETRADMKWKNGVDVDCGGMSRTDNGAEKVA